MKIPHVFFFYVNLFCISQVRLIDMMNEAEWRRCKVKKSGSIVMLNYWLWHSSIDSHSYYFVYMMSWIAESWVALEHLMINESIWAPIEYMTADHWTSCPRPNWPFQSNRQQCQVSIWSMQSPRLNWSTWCETKVELIVTQRREICYIVDRCSTTTKYWNRTIGKSTADSCQQKVTKNSIWYRKDQWCLVYWSCFQCWILRFLEKSRPPLG